MPTFVGRRDAKEFLIGKILAQAQQDKVSLSEIEVKMLYFSETAWTFPDIESVNDAFDRDYDQAKYERKITSLVRRLTATARANNRDEFEKWAEAVRILRTEDHYLLVMIDAPGASGRPAGDFLKLLVTALAIVCVFVAMVLLFTRR